LGKSYSEGQIKNINGNKTTAFPGTKFHDLANLRALITIPIFIFLLNKFLLEIIKKLPYISGEQRSGKNYASER
jgi:hypothetical protein